MEPTDLAVRYRETRSDSDFNALLASCRGLVHHVVNVYRWRDVCRRDPDGAAGVALVAFWKAADGYDPGRGAFPRYAVSLMHYAVRGWVSEQSQDRTRPLSDLASDADARGVMPDDLLADPHAADPAAALEDHERSEQVRAIVQDVCHAREAAILQAHYFQGQDLATAGRALGVSRFSASNIHCQALKRLRGPMAAGLG